MTRRQEILDTAGDLFQRRGYHATSMREIARNVSLQGSSLYAHIDSKEELLRAIVDEAADAFLMAAAGVDRTLPPPQRMRLLVAGHLQVIRDKLPYATVFFHEWAHLPAELRGDLVARRDAYQAHFRETIVAGARDGSFSVEDPALATLFVLSALNWSYQWLHPEGRLPLEVLAQRYGDMILHALGSAADDTAQEGRQHAA
ncbi:MAG TPA: TetR/AcrR family transcriptional regulator [Trueperaceae bacterium]|nr:TetR/AcrR family transcriptional regulator [Trueperaceae bacterium]